MEKLGLFGMTWEEIERRAILETLEATQGNKRKAALSLGISERTIHNKLTKYRLRDAIKTFKWEEKE